MDFVQVFLNFEKFVFDWQSKYCMLLSKICRRNAPLDRYFGISKKRIVEVV